MIKAIIEKVKAIKKFFTPAKPKISFCDEFIGQDEQIPVGDVVAILIAAVAVSGWVLYEVLKFVENYKEVVG
jgi:hypothetical protein